MFLSTEAVQSSTVYTTNAMELLLLQKAYPVRCGLTEKLLFSIIIIIIILLLL